jgi:hypothetical protein
VVIVLLNILYETLAMKLNDWENHRTASKYEAHLTFKIFLFQFVNLNASLFYIAFFKVPAMLCWFAEHICFLTHVAIHRASFLAFPGTIRRSSATATNLGARGFFFICLLRYGLSRKQPAVWLSVGADGAAGRVDGRQAVDQQRARTCPANDHEFYRLVHVAAATQARPPPRQEEER